MNSQNDNDHCEILVAGINQGMFCVEIIVVVCPCEYEFVYNSGTLCYTDNISFRTSPRQYLGFNVRLQSDYDDLGVESSLSVCFVS